MRVEFDDCVKTDNWVKNITSLVEEVQKGFEDITSVTLCGDDSIATIPIQFLQSSRELIIFKRDGMGLSFYKEGIKVFCYFSDAYYITHSNYYNFLNNMHKLQMRSLSPSSPKCTNILSDLMDTFVVCVMSGKYANSIKISNLDTRSLEPVYKHIQEGYNVFSTNPFLSFQSACIKSVLENFYDLKESVELPDHQSAKIVLPKAEELVRRAVMSTGDRASFAAAEIFYNLVSVFINSHIHNIRALRQ